MQEAIAIYSDPNIYSLAATFIDAAFAASQGHHDYGRHLTYFLLDLEARVYTNRQQVSAVNKDAGLWSIKRDLVAQMTGQDLLAPVPPHADSVRKWRQRALPRETVSKADDSVPATLATLCDAFTACAVSRARELGQFTPGKRRDFTRPQRRHAVIADGTYLTPYSQSREYLHPNGETEVLHSRAKVKKRRILKSQSQSGSSAGKGGTAVIQDAVANDGKDGRMFMGVNHDVVLTRSKYGRVVLGISRASRGESQAAVTLMDSIIEHAGDGVHTLVYDKGLSPWAAEYLMSTHGVLAVSPPTNAKGQDPETQQAMVDAKDIIRRALAEERRKSGKKPLKKVKFANTLTTAVAVKDLNNKHQVERLTHRLKNGASIGAGLPLGQSQYVNSNGDLVQSHSVDHFYGAHTHELADGRECAHDLHVDDSALWEVVTSDGKARKRQRVRCTDATCEHNGDVYELVTRHEFGCHNTGEILNLEVRFAPRTHRGPSTETRPKDQRAVPALRPVAPCDPGWGRYYNIRNDIESWFSWLKERLLADKRAASLDVNHQLLDVLYAAMIQNSLALRTGRLEGADKKPKRHK